MSLTLSQMASRVLRNVQIPEDSSSPSVQALADAKQYLNERALDVWGRRSWPEFIILGTATVSSGVQQIALSSITPLLNYNTSSNGYSATFYSVVSQWNRTDNIFPQDPGVIQRLKADLWSSTDSPNSFVNRGQKGIYNLGYYTEASTTLNFMGKANVADMSDSETWILGNDQCLIKGATADLIKYNDRDDQRADAMYAQYEAEIIKMIDSVDNQMGNSKKIIPSNPWTKSIGSRSRNFTIIGISKIR